MPHTTASRILRALPQAAAGLLGLLITAGMVSLPDRQPAIGSKQNPSGLPPEQSHSTDEVTEAVVTLDSGRSITGFLVENSEESVVIRINGIDTTFPRARVANIRLLPPVEERFRQLRDAVDNEDVRARMALVEWLRVRRAYRLALTELDGILEIEPTNSQARTIHDWIKAYLQLNAQEETGQGARRPVRDRSKDPLPSLTPEQINRIRVYEIDLRTPTRLTVPEETMRTLMVRSPEAFPVDVNEREEILKADPVDQLRIIFSLRARDLYDTVTVREDPPVMATFKSRIHGSGGWLINACASNRCHGGTDAGRLRLISRRPNSDETAYTNFYILQNFQLADGTPLINHDEPARSPLLHLALPRRSSLYPHPEVDHHALGQDWRYVHRSTTDRRFEETADWIASLYKPRPDYGINYPPQTQTETESKPEPRAEPQPQTATESETKSEPGPAPSEP